MFTKQHEGLQLITKHLLMFVFYVMAHTYNNPLWNNGFTNKSIFLD